MATELMAENSFFRFQDDVDTDIVPALFGICLGAMVTNFMFMSTLRRDAPLPAWFPDLKWSNESHGFPET